MPAPLILMGASVASSVIGGLMGSSRAKKAAREKARLQAKLDSLEKSRQAIINPYEGVKDLSSMAKDLSGMISNPYANLGVATQAAKFEAEQIDMSLANTLDTLRETGASAGGATALAQAALKSKQGISANIEQQEAQNEKLKAEGKQQMDMLKMQEAGRIQGIQISEGQRVQTAEAQGKAFVFGAREDREQQAIDRVAGQLGIAQQQQAQAQADITGSITAGIGAIGNIASAMASRTASPDTANKFTVTGEAKDSYNPAFGSSIADRYNTADTPGQVNALGQAPPVAVYGSAGNVNNYEPDYFDEVMTPYPG
jgi:hypothetical protein